MQRAKDTCLRLLRFRPRTRAELQQALARKGFDDDIIDQALTRLDDVGLIDDKSFAEVWIRSRHTYEGLGRHALVAELRRKGVDDDIAADAITTLDPATEEARARQLVRKKLRTLLPLRTPTPSTTPTQTPHPTLAPTPHSTPTPHPTNNNPNSPPIPTNDNPNSPPIPDPTNDNPNSPP
ncbi:MAG TPA: regulatory protein RecX, partial [Actinophytocola sp.]|uniref:regulatory protein RecX n=1 Tax=Actinophytocola sp. TaxID=1872138 RepID=UPI002DBF569C